MSDAPQLPPAEAHEATQEPAKRNDLRLDFEGFEGPLDLLLHLIRKHELDILDIPIAFVTEEYLRYLDAMQQLDLAVAGEYLVMAATLLHIKSKILVPRREDDELEEGEEPGDDPREVLVRQLLDYQRYRDAADFLAARDVAGRDVFARPSRAAEHRAEAPAGRLLPVDLFRLLEAFQGLMKEQPAEVLHEVTPESLSLRETINRVATYMQEHPRATLLDLVYLHGEAPTRGHIVVTFLAVLEMARFRMVKLLQTRLSSRELIVERAVVDYEEVAQRLEGIDEPT